MAGEAVSSNRAVHVGRLVPSERRPSCGNRPACPGSSPGPPPPCSRPTTRSSVTPVSCSASTSRPWTGRGPRTRACSLSASRSRIARGRPKSVDGPGGSTRCGPSRWARASGQVNEMARGGQRCRRLSSHCRRAISSSLAPPPVRRRDRQLRLAEDLVGHPRHELVLGGDVPVERHRPDAELNRQPPHGHGVEPLDVGDRDGGPGRPPRGVQRLPGRTGLPRSRRQEPRATPGFRRADHHPRADPRLDQALVAQRRPSPWSRSRPRRPTAGRSPGSTAPRSPAPQVPGQDPGPDLRDDLPVGRSARMRSSVLIALTPVLDSLLHFDSRRNGYKPKYACTHDTVRNYPAGVRRRPSDGHGRPDRGLHRRPPRPLALPRPGPATWRTSTTPHPSRRRGSTGRDREPRVAENDHRPATPRRLGRPVTSPGRALTAPAPRYEPHLYLHRTCMGVISTERAPASAPRCCATGRRTRTRRLPGSQFSPQPRHSTSGTDSRRARPAGPESPTDSPLVWPCNRPVYDKETTMTTLIFIHGTNSSAAWASGLTAELHPARASRPRRRPARTRPEAFYPALLPGPAGPRSACVRTVAARDDHRRRLRRPGRGRGPPRPPPRPGHLVGMSQGGVTLSRVSNAVPDLTTGWCTSPRTAAWTCRT